MCMKKIIVNLAALVSTTLLISLLLCAKKNNYSFIENTVFSFLVLLLVFCIAELSIKIAKTNRLKTKTIIYQVVTFIVVYCATLPWMGFKSFTTVFETFILIIGSLIIGCIFPIIRFLVANVLIKK